jgi:hypothetical protein
MNKLAWITIGTVAATGGAVAGASYVYRRRQGVLGEGTGGVIPAEPWSPDERPVPAPAPSMRTPLQWDALPLPGPADVKGDLGRNWGRTPLELRPLLQLAEEASGIDGAGHILALIAFRESRFEATAHNGDAEAEESERSASWKAYQQNKARNPPLAHGEAAAAFGSGGLFGALAPYFLWTGVQELGAKAPLLGADPRIMFVPRVATFAACVYLARLLKHYEVRDLPDIKVGWGSVSLLKGEGRSSEAYQSIRDRFIADAAELGIDLTDTTTIPARLSADAWPGVAKVFERVVGKLPTPRALA